MHVPDAYEGLFADLFCEYELNTTVYAVKWYKEENEIYRYIPDDEPNKKIFHAEGVHIDVCQDF